MLLVTFLATSFPFGSAEIQMRCIFRYNHLIFWLICHMGTSNVIKLSHLLFSRQITYDYAILCQKIFYYVNYNHQGDNHSLVVRNNQKYIVIYILKFKYYINVEPVYVARRGANKKKQKCSF